MTLTRIQLWFYFKMTLVLHLNILYWPWPLYIFRRAIYPQLYGFDQWSRTLCCV